MSEPRSPLHDKLFEMLVEGVRDYGIFALDPEGRVMTWNIGAHLLKGYYPEEIIGRHFSVFYPPDAIARGWPAQELRAATVQGRFEDEGWRLRKDGSRFWANVVITALRDENGRLLGFSKITRDLTSRRQAEETLRHSEEQFRLLIEGIEDYAIYMLLPDGIISSWNVGAQWMMGYAREEIIGKHFSTFYPTEDLGSGRPWEELAVARRIGRVEDEGWRMRKNGERFWARVVVTALHDHDGRLRGFAKVTQDLSQREHAKDLESAAKHVDEFIGMLAHELRNPLAPIRTAVELMERLPANDPVQAEMRGIVDRQSAQLIRIVDDMLDIARITSGRLSVERASVDLAEVVAGAVEIATPGMEQAQHTLSLQLPDAPLVVTGDLGRLIQAVANLLTNATRFTPAGGSIGVTAERDGEYAALRVRDNGRGIRQAEVEGIFGMFVQGKEPIHRVGGGLGIGLALVRRIAELHGGTVEVSSAGEDKGSEFTLRLPIDPAMQPQASAISDRATSEEATAFARRILVVDDNIDAAMALDGLLRSLGHTTRVAHDGAAALSIAEQFKPEVVLLDIGLPGISGYEVARQLRARHGPSPKIIAVTGWGTENDRNHSREAGFDLHLVKPLDGAALQHLLADALPPRSAH